jgi:hypothetical protein
MAEESEQEPFLLAASLEQSLEFLRSVGIHDFLVVIRSLEQRPSRMTLLAAFSRICRSPDPAPPRAYSGCVSTTLFRIVL